MLDRTMLNTSPGSRWEAMWARISSGMSQSVGGEVFIFLAGRIHACARLRYDSDTTTTRPITLIRCDVTNPRKCR